MNRKTMYTLPFIIITLIIIIVITKNKKIPNESTDYNYKNAEILNNGDNIGEIIEIDANTFKKIKESDKISIIYIGRPTCSYCVLFYPILETVAKEHNLDIFYTNIDNWLEEDVKDVLITTLDDFQGTPTVLIMYGSKQIDVAIGYQEKDNLLSFFKDNNIIKN